MCGERYQVLGRYSMMARYLVGDFYLGCGEDGLLWKGPRLGSVVTQCLFVLGPMRMIRRQAQANAYSAAGVLF
jgi:hypothetical protein